MNEHFLECRSSEENETHFKVVLNSSERRTYNVFDSANLILRNNDNNVFKLVDYINESNKRSSNIHIYFDFFN